MERYLGKSKLIRPGEALVAGIGAIVLGAFCGWIDAFEQMSAFLERYDAYQLDEFIFIALFAGLAAMVIATLRAGELAREMRKREEAEARALTLARHDPLTGLANRRVLNEDLPRVLRRHQATGRQTAVLMIDLDGFKPVNDIHGHDAGDAVLVEATARLRLACGADRLIARVGGDEFVVIADQAPDGDAVARLAGNIIRALSEPYLIGMRKVIIGATIGIARSPGDSDTAHELLRAADIAMYDAKRAGRGRHRFFNAEMDERLRARAALEIDLRTAIELGEITPYFQPVISLAENRIIGFEALARWNHPTRGLIQPDEFISIAEDLGLIEALGDRILREGCEAARDWHPDTTLSINIAPLQLHDPWLGPRLLGIMAENGFAPTRLIVEVTENAVIDDLPLAAEVFASLQAAGIRIALDDFGKGYSSLSHLKDLRFNHLKIDGSFVRSLHTVESQKIVRAVAGLGKALGMPVTAEGVETEAAAETLRRIGCEQAQGYLFGMPAPAIGAVRMLRDDDARAHPGATRVRG